MDVRTFIRRKIFRPTRNRLMAWTVPLVIRALARTLDVRYAGDLHRDGRLLEPASPGAVAAFWHHDIIGLAALCRADDLRVLISAHGDGRMIALIAARLGMKPIAGSTTRGGSQALLNILRAESSRFLVAITPDGPRGPRHHFRAGAVHLASKAQVPVYSLGVAFERCAHVRTWDRLKVPRPFSRAVVVFRDPLPVAPDLDRDGREAARTEAERRLLRLAVDAEESFEELWEAGKRFEDLPVIEREPAPADAPVSPSDVEDPTTGAPSGR